MIIKFPLKRNNKVAIAAIIDVIYTSHVQSLNSYSYVVISLLCMAIDMMTSNNTYFQLEMTRISYGNCFDSRELIYWMIFLSSYYHINTN